MEKNAWFEDTSSKEFENYIIKNQHECENESSNMEKEMIEEGDILELEPVMVPSGNYFFLYLNIFFE